MAFPAVARSVYLIAAHPDDNKRRILLPIKNNLADDSSGFAYKIQGDTWDSKLGKIITSHIAWEAEPITDLTVNDLGSAEKARLLVLEKAKMFLQGILCRGPVLHMDIEDAARKLKISLRTLERAKAQLNVGSGKEETENGAWRWFLPNDFSHEKLDKPKDAS